jgi:protein-tyrosine phosphatase
MQGWDGAVNFRQVLPGLIRSGNLSFLTEQGRGELLASGVARIIDLRNRAERQIDAAPFESYPMYLNLPLLPHRNQAMNQASADARSNADFYRAYLDHAGNQMATIFGAMLDAPLGPVLIHCHLSKERTGLVAALTQELCGVPRSDIAAAYAETDLHVAHLYAAQLSAQPDAEKRAWLAGFQASRPEDILAALAHLDAVWGGVHTYLEAFGMKRAEQHQLAARMLKTDS